MQNLLSNVLSLTPLKRLIATTIQSQLSRFIEGIELDSLGLLGGDLVLENLELRKDVVQELLGIPMAFDLDRGFIKELRIHIPWTRLTSKPIEIKFHTVEIVVVPTKRDEASAPAHEPAAGSHDDEPSSEDNRSDPGDDDVDAAAAAVASEAASAPSWTQTLIKRALANISLTVENLVLKLDDGEVVLSATLPSFRVHSADPDLGWECRWLNPFGPYQLMHKLVEAKQLTVCLDRYTSGGIASNKRARSIVGYERPLLDRVSLTVRLQIPLERRPAFERLEREQQGNRVLSEGAQADQDSLAAYGSGDLSSGYFDDAYGWAGVDGGSFADNSAAGPGKATPNLSPIFKLPCASNCGRALAGDVRRPWVRQDGHESIHTVGGPFDDREELWVPMPGWSSPDLNFVDPLAEKYYVDEESSNSASTATQVLPSEMPIPSLVADMHCAALKFSFSERQINMLHSLMKSTAGSVGQSVTNANHSPKRNPRAKPKVSPRVHSEVIGSQTTVEDSGNQQIAMDLDPPVQNRSWLSRIFYKDDANGLETDNVASETQPGNISNFTVSKPTEGGMKKANHSLVIVSMSFPYIAVDLLRHSSSSDGIPGDNTPLEGSTTRGTSEAGHTDEGGESDNSEESLNVPVFGLGVVKVDGLKSQRRKAESPHSQSRKRDLGHLEVETHDNRLPESFLRLEVKHCTIDSHQLNGGGLSFLDTKLQICGASISPTGALLASLSFSSAMPSHLLQVGLENTSSLSPEALLFRSSEHLLSNYALLRCDDSTLSDSLRSSNTSNCKSNPVKDAALEVRFLNISSKPSHSLGIANEESSSGLQNDKIIIDEDSSFDSNGLSLDVRVGVTELNWSEKVVDHLHGFLLEAAAISTGKASENEPSGSSEAYNQQKTKTSPVLELGHRMHFYYVDCSAVTTTHIRDITSIRVEPDTSGVFSAATTMTVKQPQLAYSVVGTSESFACEYAKIAGKLLSERTEDVSLSLKSFEIKHIDRFGFHVRSSTELSPIIRQYDSGSNAMNECIFHTDGLSVHAGIKTTFLERLHNAPIKVLLKCNTKVEVSKVIAVISFDNLHAFRGFLNAAHLLTKLGQAQVLEHLPLDQQLQKSSSHSSPARNAHAFKFCACDLTFGVSAQGARKENGIEHSANFALSGDAGSFSLIKRGTRKHTSIVTTQHAAGAESSGAAVSFISGQAVVENPSEAFLDWFCIHSGSQVLDKKLNKQKKINPAASLPTLQCDMSIGQAHIDVQGAMRAFAALGAMSSMFFDTIANQSMLPPKAQKKAIQVAAPLDMTEFAIVPKIKISAWLLWLSPHLVFKSPEIGIVEADASEQIHLDCSMTMTGSKLLATTSQFSGGPSLQLPSTAHEVFSSNQCITRAKIPRKEFLPTKVTVSDIAPLVKDVASVNVEISDVCIDLDATKVAILSACLKSLTVNARSREQFSQVKEDEDAATSMGDNAVTNSTPPLSQENEAPAPVPLLPPTGHRKRLDLSFDEVFKQVEMYAPAEVSEPPMLKIKPSFQPVVFEASLSKFSLALRLQPSSAGQPSNVDNYSSNAFQVAFHNIQVSSTVEFGGQRTGSDRWRIFSNKSKHSHTPTSPTIGISSEVVENASSFFEVKTYRFAIGGLGACEEDWAKSSAESPLGFLLLTIFASEPSSAALAYYAPHHSFSTLAPLIAAYLGEHSSSNGLAPLALALALGIGLSRPRPVPRYTPSETAAKAPWPWLCAEKSDSSRHVWVEAQFQRETAMIIPESSSPEAKDAPYIRSAQRPKAHLRLRKSDVLFHLPTLAAVADLLHGLVPRIRPGTASNSKAESTMSSNSTQLQAKDNCTVEGEGPVRLLPLLSFEVQPLRVLVVYTRMQTNDWSAIAAFQWSLTLSAKSNCSTVHQVHSKGSTVSPGAQEEKKTEPFRVVGMVGPMDVATVSWKRRSRIRSGLALSDVSAPGSVVLQGPTASNFETNQCYAMAQEVLFGDPFEFSVVAEETLAQRLNALNPGASDDVADAAQLRVVVEASPAIFTCQPDQYAACLNLLASVGNAARSVASTRAAHAARIQRLLRIAEPMSSESTGTRNEPRTTPEIGGFEDTRAYPSVEKELEEYEGEIDENEASGNASSSTVDHSYRSQRGHQKTPTAKVASTGLPNSLRIKYSFSAPEVKITLFSPRPAPSSPMSTSMTHLSLFRPSSSTESTTSSAYAIPLLELHTSHVTVAGTSPGASSFTVDNCAIRCWPCSSPSSLTSPQGVALFGLAAESTNNECTVNMRSSDTNANSNSTHNSTYTSGPAEEPLLRVDWTTDLNGHLPNDVLAQLRPVFLFASPAVLAALLHFASQGIPNSAATQDSSNAANTAENNSDAAPGAAALAADKEEDAKFLTPLRYPLPLNIGPRYMANYSSLRHSASAANSSFLGNVSVKFLSRQIQMVAATEAEGKQGPAVIFTISHVFLNKKKAKPVNHDEKNADAPAPPPNGTTLDADTRSMSDEHERNHHEGCVESDSGSDNSNSSTTSESTSSSEDEDGLDDGVFKNRKSKSSRSSPLGLPRSVAEDEIMLNALGCSLEFRTDYRRRSDSPLTPGESYSEESYSNKTTGNSNDSTSSSSSQRSSRATGASLPITSARELEIVNADACFVPPCELSLALRGQILNELQPMALVDVAVDCDELCVNLSAERLQVLFAVANALVNALNLPPPPPSPLSHSGVNLSNEPLPPCKRPHPALVLPPTPSITTHRLQLAAPLDVFADRRLDSVHRRHQHRGQKEMFPSSSASSKSGLFSSVSSQKQQLPPPSGVLLFGNNLGSSSRGSVDMQGKTDPRAAAESTAAQQFWIAPEQPFLGRHSQNKIRTHAIHQNSSNSSSNVGNNGSVPLVSATMPSVMEQHRAATLARSECLAVVEWFACAHWAYGTPRSVLRLEMKQVALPKAVMASRNYRNNERYRRHNPSSSSQHQQSSGSELAVVHLSLERRDPTSRMWVRSALLSVPLVTVDPPPVTHQHPHRSTNTVPGLHNQSSAEGETAFDGVEGDAPLSDDSVSDPVWASWLEGGEYAAWCQDHPHRSSLKYLVPPNQPASEWRLLWACPDLTRLSAGISGNSETAHLNRALPQLLMPSLGVASVQDLPLLALSWRARKFRVCFLSPTGQLLSNFDHDGSASCASGNSSRTNGGHGTLTFEDGSRCRPPEALVDFDASFFGASLTVASATWASLVAPAFFVDGDLRMKVHDFATLTSAGVASVPRASVWVRTLPRGATSYFATTAVTCAAGDGAHLRASPKLLKAFKVLGNELATMFQPPPTPSRNMHQDYSQNCQYGDGTDNDLENIDSAHDENGMVPSVASPAPPNTTYMNDSLRYVIENATNEPLWFGQQATAESLMVNAGKSCGYSWRELSNDPIWTRESSNSASDLRGAGLSLRFALSSNTQTSDNAEDGERMPTNRGYEGSYGSSSSFSPGAWSEPVRIDHSILAGINDVVTQRVSVLRDHCSTTSGGVSNSGAVVCALIVTVQKRSLQTVVTLRGKFALRCTIPRPMQVRLCVLSMGAAVAVTAAASVSATAGSSSVALYAPAADFDNNEQKQAQEEHPSRQQEKGHERQQRDDNSILTTAASAASAILISALQTCGQAHCAVVSANASVDSFVLLPENDFQLDAAVVAAAEAVAREALTNAPSASGFAEAAAAAIRKSLAEPSTSASDTKSTINHFPSRVPGAQHRRASDALAGMGEGSPFIAVQTRPEGRGYDWSSPALLSLRTGAVLFDTFAHHNSKGQSGDSNSCSSGHGDGTSSISSSIDCGRSNSSSSSSVGGSLDTGSTSHGTGNAPNPSPRHRYPNVAQNRKRSSPLVHVLAATGSFNAESVHCAEVALRSARVRHRSLAAVMAPPMAAKGASAAVATNDDGGCSTSASPTATTSAQSSIGRGTWAVVSTRPLQWPATALTSSGGLGVNNKTAPLTSTSSSGTNSEWTLLELSSPLVLHNDHSEPLLMALRRRGKDSDTAGSLLEGASTEYSSSPSPVEPRPFGRSPAIRTNFSSTSSSQSRNSRYPPPPPTAEPYTPPPSSPSLRAVDAARERLAAKMSKVAASQYTEGHEANHENNGVGSDSESGSYGGRMSLNHSTPNSIEALDNTDGVYVVQVPAHGHLSLNANPLYNYTATVLRETRPELSALSAAAAAASHLYNRFPSSSSYYSSPARPLIANLALPVRDLLVPYENNSIDINKDSRKYADIDSSLPRQTKSPSLLPPFQLQVNSLLLGPASAARYFPSSSYRQFPPYSSTDSGGGTGYSRPGSFSFAPTGAKQTGPHVNGQSASASDLSEPGLPPLSTDSASSSFSSPPSPQLPVSGLTAAATPLPPFACYAAAAESLASSGGISNHRILGALHCRLGPRALIRNRLDVALWVEVSTKRSSSSSSSYNSGSSGYGSSSRIGEGAAAPIVVCIPPRESRPMPVLPEIHFDSRQSVRRERGYDSHRKERPALRFGTAIAWRRSDGRVTLVQSAGAAARASSGEQVIVGWSRRFALGLLNNYDGDVHGQPRSDALNEERRGDSESVGEHQDEREDGDDDEESSENGISGDPGNSRTLQFGADASLVAIFHPADRDRDLVLPLLVKVLPPGALTPSAHEEGPSAGISGAHENEGSLPTSEETLPSSSSRSYDSCGPATFPAAHVHDPIASLTSKNSNSSQRSRSGASGKSGGSSSNNNSSSASTGNKESSPVAASIWGATGGAPAVIDVTARLAIVSPPIGAHGLRLDLLLAEDNDAGATGGLQGRSQVGQRPLWMEVPALEEKTAPLASTPTAGPATDMPAGSAVGGEARAVGGAVNTSWSRCLLGVAAVDADAETASEAGIDDSTDGDNSMHSSRSNGVPSNNSSQSSTHRHGNTEASSGGRLSWLFGGWRCASSEQIDRGKRERARQRQERAFGAAADFRYRVSFLGSQTIVGSIGRSYGANSMHDDSDDNNAPHRPVFEFHPTPAVLSTPPRGATENNGTSRSTAAGAAEEESINAAAGKGRPADSRDLCQGMSSASVGGAPSTGVAVTAAQMVVPWRSPSPSEAARSHDQPTKCRAPGVEHRLMTVASHISPNSGAAHVFITPVREPPLLVKNVGRWGNIEFQIDEDEPFGAALLPFGGSAEYDWRHQQLPSLGSNEHQKSADTGAAAGAKASASSHGGNDGRKGGRGNSHEAEDRGSDLLHPKPQPSHAIRLRLARTNTNAAVVPAEAAAAAAAPVAAWSEPLRIAEGVQMATLLSTYEAQVVATLHVYHRAGALVALLWCESDNYGNSSPGSSSGTTTCDQEALPGSGSESPSLTPNLSTGWEALKRYSSGRPCHLDVSFAAMGRFTVHLVDDAAPAVLRPPPPMSSPPPPSLPSPSSTTRNSRAGASTTETGAAAAQAAAAADAAEEWALEQAFNSSSPASQPALVYREIAQLHSTNLSVRMAESPPEPRRLVTSTPTTGNTTTANMQSTGNLASSNTPVGSASAQELITAGATPTRATTGVKVGAGAHGVDSPGPQFYFPEETSHIKYTTRFTCRAQDVQMDSSLTQGEFPVVLWCEPSPAHAAATAAAPSAAATAAAAAASVDASILASKTTKSGRRRQKQLSKSVPACDPVPCVDMTVEMVSVHQPTISSTPSNASSSNSSSWRAPLLPCDHHVAPYTSLVKVNLPRKVVVAFEDPFLAAMAEAANQFLDASDFSSSGGGSNRSGHGKSNSVAFSSGEESNAIVVSSGVENEEEEEDPEKVAVLAWVAASTTTLVYVGYTEISDLEASATLRVVMPGSNMFIGLDQTPLYFRKLVLKRAHASARRLANEVSASYAADALLRSPQLVGSLQLLGAPTSLWRSVTAGLRDLVAFPLEAVPQGPVAVLRGALRGTSSFARHVSGGALSSVSGFASSASRNLQTWQAPSSPPQPHVHRRRRLHRPSSSSSVPPRAAADDDCGEGDDDVEYGDSYNDNYNYGENFGDGQDGSDGDSLQHPRAAPFLDAVGAMEEDDDGEEEEEEEEDGGEDSDGRSLARRVFEGVGRGLVVAPLVGAMRIVGRGTAALSQTVVGGGSQGISNTTAATPRQPLPLARLPGGTPMVSIRALGLWQRTALIGARDPSPLLFAAPVAAAQAPSSTSISSHAFRPSSAAAEAAAPVSAGVAATESHSGGAAYDVTTGHLYWVPATLLLTQAALHLHAVGRGNALWLSLPLHVVPLECVQQHRRPRSGNHRSTPFLVLSEPENARFSAAAPAAAATTPPPTIGASPSSSKSHVATQSVVVIGLSPSHHAVLVEAIEKAQRRHAKGATTGVSGVSSRTDKYTV